MDMTAHTLHNCGAWDCRICEGGLSLCMVCGGAEASMPKECPGVEMTPEQADAVQSGDLDYHGWAMVEKGKDHEY